MSEEPTPQDCETALDRMFNPQSVALIGASDEENSVGFRLMKNLTESDFKGGVYPVNLKKDKIKAKSNIWLHSIR